MLNMSFIALFFNFMLLSFLGIHTAHCHQLSFKEGNTVPYLITKVEKTITNSAGKVSHSQSDIAIALDIKLLSHDTITHWFSRNSHRFAIEVLIKSISLSNTIETEDPVATTVHQYDSTGQPLGSDPVEQTLHTLTCTPLHFQIDLDDEDTPITETTMQLETIARCYRLSNKWKDCKFHYVLEKFLKDLFDLVGENLVVDRAYTIYTCNDKEEMKDNIFPLLSLSKVYKIHEIDTKKTTATASCTTELNWKINRSPLQAKEIIYTVSGKTIVSWDNENSLLQTREGTRETFIECLLNSDFFACKTVSQESWRVNPE